MTIQEIQDTIITIVRSRQRQLAPTRGVLPKTVQCFLDFYRCEQTLRRDMSAMARQGLLVRIGGEGSRRGYRVNDMPPQPMPRRPRIVIEIMVRVQVVCAA